MIGTYLKFESLVKQMMILVRFGQKIMVLESQNSLERKYLVYLKHFREEMM
jgi:hypothetical protein